jgi:hypothetical protein
MSAPPILALELGNNIGDPLSYDDEGLLIGMLENWDPERFERLWDDSATGADLDATPLGAFFGGVLEYQAVSDWGDVGESIRRTIRRSPVNLWGQAVTVRVEPVRLGAGDHRWTFGLWGPGSVVQVWWSARAVAADSLDEIRAVAIVPTNSPPINASEALMPYNRINHAWVRIGHDPVENRLFWQTGPSCGALATVMTQELSDGSWLNAVRPGVHFTGFDGPPGVPGRIHEIYLDPFRPEMLADI